MSPTSPGGHRGYNPAGASPQGLDVYPGGAEMASFMPAASPQPLPPLHVKAVSSVLCSYLSIVALWIYALSEPMIEPIMSILRVLFLFSFLLYAKVPH